MIINIIIYISLFLTVGWILNIVTLHFVIRKDSDYLKSLFIGAPLAILPYLLVILFIFTKLEKRLPGERQ